MDRVESELTDRLPPRARLGWWAFVFLLGAAVAYVVGSFIGLVVLGLFGYYATRPICVRLRSVTGSRHLAAMLTALSVLVPILLLFVLAGLRLFQAVQRQFEGGELVGTLISRITGVGALSTGQRDQLVSLLSNPSSALDASGSFWSNVGTAVTALQGVLGGLFLLGLATTLAYFLLANDADVSEGLIELFGGRDSTAYAYAVAVDADLESVFFGNLLFVVASSVLATVTYAVTNLVAPPGLQVPMVLVAGILTGLASLIPVVVGKIVYIPIVASLGFQAVSTDQSQGSLVFVGVVLVAYVLLLDVLPQSFLQPYLSGRRIDPILLLFAYLIGPILFGWYGFFLMPILFVLVLEAIRIVLPELLSGEQLRPEATVAEEIGTDPQEARAERDDAQDDTQDDAQDDTQDDDSGSDLDRDPDPAES
ncbi:Predicted PurR-regulated permease PerM [Halorubrum aquaticum]|uniref:Predicted PurR-regulated permease PerM n=1 Tax=Halorubrum aquaticum TaxID=387340 RepID=A0A1I3A2K9_9EURY|nr:AI-2E family transporter [Halorubrum aquaticum]SFH44238.1 Predicted PurR-regulated permease PerM [Halorubrum aquaticum]